MPLHATSETSFDLLRGLDNLAPRETVVEPVGSCNLYQKSNNYINGVGAAGMPIIFRIHMSSFHFSKFYPTSNHRDYTVITMALLGGKWGSKKP